MTVLGDASSSVSMTLSTAFQLPTELWGNASTWACVDKEWWGKAREWAVRARRRVLAVSEGCKPNV